MTKQKLLSRKMAEANAVTGDHLEVLISDICSIISTLNPRETEIRKNATSEVDLVERDDFLCRIRVERRELSKELAEHSAQKAVLDIDVESAEESSNDYYDDHDDDYDLKTAVTLKLADARAAEYSR